MPKKTIPFISILTSAFVLITASIVLVFGIGLFFYINIPSAKNLGQCLTTTMFQVKLCPKGPNYTPLKRISPYLRNAVVASEDAAFWDHDGIDWFELRKSFETNLEKGRFARGGSTITQQLAKNVYLGPQKSILRKIEEMVIATRIERLYSKKFILEKYLNVVEFKRGIYGAKAAANYYFNKSPADLSLTEAAWLVFLLPNPESYSVSFKKGKLSPFAKKQMGEIIHRLFRFKKISEEEKDYAITQLNSFFARTDPDINNDALGNRDFEESQEPEE